jgi:hypothetical protein
MVSHLGLTFSEIAPDLIFCFVCFFHATLYRGPQLPATFET